MASKINKMAPIQNVAPNINKMAPKLIRWHQKLIIKPRKFLQALHPNHFDLQYGDFDDHDYGYLDWGDHGDHGRSVYSHF